MAAQAPPEVTELLQRSNRLGSDPANTNYAGGNTSAKGEVTDPVTGEPAGLMWVKGSGGDLGTLTAEGLAVLRLDRLRALTGVYPGVEREDEMVAAFDYCRHGWAGWWGQNQDSSARPPRSTPRCTGWWTRRTWTTCTPTRGSRSPPRPTARR